MFGFCSKCNRLVQVPVEKRLQANCVNCKRSLKVSIRPLRQDSTEGVVFYYEDESELWYQVIDTEKQYGIAGYKDLQGIFRDDLNDFINRKKVL